MKAYQLCSIAPCSGLTARGKRLKIETSRRILVADQAIITLPTSILADAEQLFAPALPEKVEAARGLPLGLNDKLFLSLDGAEEFEKDCRLFGAIDRTATATYHLRPFGRPQIEVYFGGDLPARLEAGGISAFFDFAVSELTGILGNNFARRVAPIHIHCWGADPFARGSYSYALPGMADCRATLAAPVDDRLFFAGEPARMAIFQPRMEIGLRASLPPDQAISALRKNAAKAGK